MTKLFIFDLDGTIIDTYKQAIEINKKITKKQFNLIVTKTDFSKMFDDNFFKSMIQYLKQNLSFFEYLKVKLHFKNKIEEFKKNYISEIIKKEDQIKLFKNIDKTLLKLKQKKNLKIALVTSDFSNLTNRILKKLKINIFDDVLCAEYSLSKVEKINYLVKKYKINKEDAYYIGDTIGDILEAKTAGIKTIIVSYGFHMYNHIKNSKIKADYIARSVLELDQKLNEILELKKNNKKNKKLN